MKCIEKTAKFSGKEYAKIEVPQRLNMNDIYLEMKLVLIPRPTSGLILWQKSEVKNANNRHNNKWLIFQQKIHCFISRTIVLSV